MSIQAFAPFRGAPKGPRERGAEYAVALSLPASPRLRVIHSVSASSSQGIYS